MKIHPIFHNSLLKLYHETKEHCLNHEKPAPEIVDGEEGHYEIKTILMAQPTCTKKSTQYLIKWKGYPASENVTAEAWYQLGRLVGCDGEGDVPAQSLGQAQLRVSF